MFSRDTENSEGSYTAFNGYKSTGMFSVFGAKKIKV